jgi:AcrR family transcriptional regulator
MPRAVDKSRHEEGRSAVKAARTQWRTRQVLEAATTLMERTDFHAMSIQALADEADVSVGLIYQYFGSKEDVLHAVILDTLEAYGQTVPAAIAAAGDDHVDRIVAGFTAYGRTLDSHHQAATLAYRESKTLPTAALEEIKQLELSTVAPLFGVIRAGQEAGIFLPVDAELMTHNLMMAAHSWALKHWHLSPRYTLEDYLNLQLAQILRTLLPAASWPTYSDRIANLAETAPSKALAVKSAKAPAAKESRSRAAARR